MGGYVQAYTLYSSVRPFGVTAILGGWDSEAELGVDGQVGSGPDTGAGGKLEDEAVTKGGPGLYMIEPSGLYWVSTRSAATITPLTQARATTVLPLARAGKLQRQSLRSLISPTPI